MTGLRYCVAAAALTACSAVFPARMHPGELQSSGPPALVVGSFDDDYGSTHEISDKEWRHGKSAVYHVIRWDRQQQFLIALNGDKNPSDPGLWSRFDWMPLPADMAPYTWAFCMSAYKAKTAEEAEQTAIAKRETPKTGCNGFPFTRMKSRRDAESAEARSKTAR